MFKFLAFLFILGFFGFVVVGVIFGRAIRFFGSADQTRDGRKKTSNKNKSNRSAKSQSPTYSHKKFSKDEGEYISYEEIKDE